jgi:hypothetical protein
MGAQGGHFAVTPPELEAAGEALAGVERELSIDNDAGIGGLAAADVGSPALAGALSRLSDRLDMLAAALSGVVTAASVNVAQGGRAYTGVDQLTAASFGTVRR